MILFVADLPGTISKKKQLDSNTFTLSAEQYPCVIHWRCNIVWVSHVYVFHWYHHVIPIKALGKFAVYFISFAISPLIHFILVWHTIWDFDTHLIKILQNCSTSKIKTIWSKRLWNSTSKQMNKKKNVLSYDNEFLIQNYLKCVK